MAPPLPMGPCKARTIGLGGAAAGSLVWGANASPINQLRDDGASALGGCRLIEQTPTINLELDEAAGGMLERRHAGRLECGGHGAIL